MKTFFKRWGGWFLKLGISVLLVYLLLKKYDLSEAIQNIQSVRSDMLILSCLLTLGVIVLCALRWQLLIKMLSNGTYPSFKDIFAINYVAQFSSLFLPATGGSDMVKVICLKRLGTTLTETVSNVAIDRLLSFLTLIYAGLVGLPLGWQIEAFRPILITYIVSAAIGTFVLLAASLLHKVPFLANQKWLAQISKDLHMLFARPIKGMAVIGTSVISSVLFSLAYYTVACGLNIDVTMTSCLVLVPIIVLIITLPISISGWGVREQAVITGFALIYVPPEQALLLSITIGAIVTLTSLPGLFFWINMKKG